MNPQARLWAPSALAGAAALGAACGSDPATEITTGVESLAFRGTSEETIEIQANGSWEAEATPSWLSVENGSGSGSDTIAVRVDRTDLEVGAHNGSVTVRGETSTTVPVLARFPEVSGSVGSSEGHLAATERAPEPDRFDAPRVEGEIIIRLDENMVALEEHGHLDAEASPRGLEIAAERLGARVGAHSSQLFAPELGLALLELGGDIESAIESLEAEGHILYAEPNIISEPAAVDDPLYDEQWHYDNIRLEEAWEVTTGYEEVRVAVIDGDFHPDHPDLVDNFLPGWDFVRDQEDFYTFNEGCGAHGSHVAGTVAAVTDNGVGVAGVAPDVRVIPMNVARLPEDEDPERSPCQLDGVATVRAIRWAAGLDDNAAGTIDRPVDVINLSLGSGEFRHPPREDALAFAREEGVLPVGAAGNDSTDVGYPARNASTIAVSATNPDDELANYSNFGNDLYLAAPGGEMFVDGEAFPERGVISTSWDYDPEEGTPDHNYEPKQGTSMASPHVAGVVALVRSANPQLSPSEVQELLAETADTLGNEGWTPELGYGLVDAGAAVAAARDNLEVDTQTVVVRLVDGDTVVAEAELDAGGEFELGQVAAGEYTLVAGDERYGEQGVPGTLYGEQSLTISYEGDVEADVALSPQ